jgi:hypothetical protein
MRNNKTIYKTNSKNNDKEKKKFLKQFFYKINLRFKKKKKIKHKKLFVMHKRILNRLIFWAKYENNFLKDPRFRTLINRFFKLKELIYPQKFLDFQKFFENKKQKFFFLSILSYFTLKQMLQFKKKKKFILKENSTKKYLLIPKNKWKKLYSMKKTSENSIRQSLLKNFVNEKKQKNAILIKNKIKMNEEILNMNVVYDRFNAILFKNGLKGFTPDAFRLFVHIINDYSKNLILKIRRIAIIRQKTNKRKQNEWGRNGIIFTEKESSSIPKKIREMEKRQHFFKTEILMFKKRKKRKAPKKKFEDYFFKPVIKKIPPKKKKLSKKELLKESIDRANKTLMTFLDGILQRRMKMLKEATKCLCKYRPLPIKYHLLRKKQEASLNPHMGIFVYKPVAPFYPSRYENYLTADDCLYLIKNDSEEKFKKFFIKWFFMVGFDHNFRISEEII